MIRYILPISLIISLNLGSLVHPIEAQDALPASQIERIEQQVWNKRGQQLYQEACAPCHGLSGDGQGPAAPGLYPQPHDFTKGLYKFRTTPITAMPTDADLVRTISEGIPGTAMPAWKRLLSPSQRLALAHYLKTLAAEKFAQTPAAPVLVLPPAPAFTPERVARGKALYQRLQCRQCHGAEGRGNGPIARQLRDAWNRPIRPQNFTKGIYKSGNRPEDLLRTILTGLAGTPMPPWSNAISVEEGWDLVAYARSLSRAGTIWYYLFTDTGKGRPGP
jgi:mono/diheme cytochrome c family protein